jgi:hypothetical protein
MTVIGALSSFRELGEVSPHKRASSERCRLVGYWRADSCPVCRACCREALLCSSGELA